MNVCPEFYVQDKKSFDDSNRRLANSRRINKKIDESPWMYAQQGMVMGQDRIISGKLKFDTTHSQSFVHPTLELSERKEVYFQGTHPRLSRFALSHLGRRD